MKKKNNKGFSLIEIVVTLALMAIITGATVGIYSWIHSSKVKSASKTLDSAISELRSLTLSQSNEWKMTVSKGTGNYKVTISKGIKNGLNTVWKDYKNYSIDDKVSIYCINPSGQKSEIGKNYGGVDNCNIVIEYQKSNGSYKTMVCNRTNSVNFNISDIYINYTKYDRKIHLVELTGKHSVDK